MPNWKNENKRAVDSGLEMKIKVVRFLMTILLLSLSCRLQLYWLLWSLLPLTWLLEFFLMLTILHTSEVSWLVSSLGLFCYFVLNLGGQSDTNFLLKPVWNLGIILTNMCSVSWPSFCLSLGKSNISDPNSWLESITEDWKNFVLVSFLVTFEASSIHYIGFI